MRPTFYSFAVFDDERREANARSARARGLRQLAGYRADAPLAVVGASPSVINHLEELRAWPGDVWALNGMVGWLHDRGVESTLFSIDPDPILATQCDGVESALLADECDPSVFAALGDAIVTVFPLWTEDNPSGRAHNGTSATCALSVAAKIGAVPLTLFGCSSSFRQDTAYSIYGSELNGQQFTLVVRANGSFFLTVPSLLSQAETLAQAIREFPKVFFEKSGGLLTAMVADPEWSVVAMSPKLQKLIERQKEDFEKRGPEMLENLRKTYNEVSVS